MSAHKDHKQNEIDEISGVETTGHEWDGLKELNNPAPRWWLIVWLICIVISIIYMVFYPAWPTLKAHTKGILGWTQYSKLEAEQKVITDRKAVYLKQFHGLSLDQVKQNPAVFEFARQGGEAVFKENCAPCHGIGGAGRVGYPNLNDNDWLFGGTPDQILHTLKVGARSGHPDAFQTQMPAFGKDQILTKNQISLVSDYVLALSKPAPALETPAFTEGKTLFEANCAACHGLMGEGNQEMGAPKLNDAIWLYGGDKPSIIKTVTYSRAGVMPSWQSRLSEDNIKMAAIYVHSLGGEN